MSTHTDCPPSSTSLHAFESTEKRASNASSNGGGRRSKTMSVVELPDNELMALRATVESQTSITLPRRSGSHSSSQHSASALLVAQDKTKGADFSSEKDFLESLPSSTRSSFSKAPLSSSSSTATSSSSSSSPSPAVGVISSPPAAGNGDEAVGNGGSRRGSLRSPSPLLRGHAFRGELPPLGPPRGQSGTTTPTPGPTSSSSPSTYGRSRATTEVQRAPTSPPLVARASTMPPCTFRGELPPLGPPRGQGGTTTPTPGPTSSSSPSTYGRSRATTEVQRAPTSPPLVARASTMPRRPRRRVGVTLSPGGDAAAGGVKGGVGGGSPGGAKRDRSRSRRGRGASNGADFDDANDWPVERVILWLRQLGPSFERYVKAFRDNGVDGRCLLEDMDETTVADIVQVNLHRKKILRSIKDLQAESETYQHDRAEEAAAAAVKNAAATAAAKSSTTPPAVSMPKTPSSPKRQVMSTSFAASSTTSTLATSTSLTTTSTTTTSVAVATASGEDAGGNNSSDRRRPPRGSHRMRSSPLSITTDDGDADGSAGGGDGLTFAEFLSAQPPIVRARSSSQSSESAKSPSHSMRTLSVTLSSSPLLHSQRSPRLRAESSDFSARRPRTHSIDKTRSPRNAQARDSFAGLSTVPVAIPAEHAPGTPSPKKRPRMLRAKSSQITHLKSGGMAFLNLSSSRKPLSKQSAHTGTDIPTISEEGSPRGSTVLRDSVFAVPLARPSASSRPRSADSHGGSGSATHSHHPGNLSLRFAPRPPSSPPPESPPPVPSDASARNALALQRPSTAASPRGSAPAAASTFTWKSRSLSSSEGRALAMSVKTMRASVTLPRPPAHSPPAPGHGRRSPSPNTIPRPPSHPPSSSSFRSTSTSSSKMGRAATISRSSGLTSESSDYSPRSSHKKSVSYAHTLSQHSLTLSPSRSKSSSSHMRSMSHAGRGRGRVSSPSSVSRSTSPVLSTNVGNLSRSPSRDSVLRRKNSSGSITAPASAPRLPSFALTRAKSACGLGLTPEEDTVSASAGGGGGSMPTSAPTSPNMPVHSRRRDGGIRREGTRSSKGPRGHRRTRTSPALPAAQSKFKTIPGLTLPSSAAAAAAQKSNSNSPPSASSTMPKGASSSSSSSSSSQLPPRGGSSLASSSMSAARQMSPTGRHKPSSPSFGALTLRSSSAEPADDSLGSGSRRPANRLRRRFANFETVQGFLQIPTARQYFKEYLKSRFAAENLLFWMECSDYTAITLHSKRPYKYKSIVDKYLRSDAELMVNLPAKIMDEIMNVDELDPPVAVFENAQKSVIRLLRTPFSEFLDSDQYRKYLTSQANRSDARSSTTGSTVSEDVGSPDELSGDDNDNQSDDEDRFSDTESERSRSSNRPTPRRMRGTMVPSMAVNAANQASSAPSGSSSYAATVGPTMLQARRQRSALANVGWDDEKGGDSPRVDMPDTPSFSNSQSASFGIGGGSSRSAAASPRAAPGSAPPTQRKPKKKPAEDWTDFLDAAADGEVATDTDHAAFLAKAKTGEDVFKHGRRGAPHKRRIRIDAAKKMLLYKSSRGVLFSEMVRAAGGKASDVLQRSYAQDVVADRCLTIELKPKSKFGKSIDLQFSASATRDLWLKHLQRLILDHASDDSE